MFISFFKELVVSKPDENFKDIFLKMQQTTADTQGRLTEMGAQGKIINWGSLLLGTA